MARRRRSSHSTQYINKAKGVSQTQKGAEIMKWYSVNAVLDAKLKLAGTPRQAQRSRDISTTSLLHPPCHSTLVKRHPHILTYP